MAVRLWASVLLPLCGIVAGCTTPLAPFDGGRMDARMEDVRTLDTPALDAPGPDTPAGPCVLDSDCDDGEFCNGSERCDASACVAGPPADCDDGIACTIDRCDGACRSTPDNSACTAASGGRCDPETLGCQYDTCSPATCTTSTECQGAACAGAVCMRRSLCDTGELCCGGTCRDCDDGNLCTDDVCEGSNCVHVPNARPCDDDRPCTVNDRCEMNRCRGTDVECDDGNPCTSESCEQATGECRVPNDRAAGFACGTIDPITCAGMVCDGMGTCVTRAACPGATSCCMGVCGSTPC